MSFLSVLKAIGQDFEKGLAWAVKYAIPVETLVGILYPPAIPVLAPVITATELLQTAVVQVEQKYAASGVQNGTGAQKLAEVLLLAENAVTSLLAQAGIKADTTYITNLVNAIVAILNVQQSTGVPTAAAALKGTVLGQ